MLCAVRSEAASSEDRIGNPLVSRVLQNVAGVVWPGSGNQSEARIVVQFQTNPVLANQSGARFFDTEATCTSEF